MLTIDGSRFSGSGTIVRQAVAFSAVTGRPFRLVHARVRRPKPGLRAQHVRVVNAVAQLAGAFTQGVEQGSQDFTFEPGAAAKEGRFEWNIGSAGSTTLLALAVLPVLALRTVPTEVELRGGIFQDFAPSFYHVERVVLPLLRRMGIQTDVSMKRPGYVPRGEGLLHLAVQPCSQPFLPLSLEEQGKVTGIHVLALASHLSERKVAQRMAQRAQEAFSAAGYRTTVEIIDDAKAAQPGAALMACASLSGGSRLGADRAGAPKRRAEEIGRSVSHMLMEDLASGAAVDRHAADQLMPFAALALGESRIRVPFVTDHILSSAWLAREFLEADIKIEGRLLRIVGGSQRTQVS
jgi:RNA 3'-terminal phosphate cyclase (ATP)